MKSDETTPRKVVEYAVREQVSLVDAAKMFTRSRKACFALTARVNRYLEKKPRGNHLYERLLRRSSHYELDASALLVMDPDAILDAIAENGISILSIARGSGNKRRSYQFWYTRLYRHRPQAIARLQSAPDVPVDWKGEPTALVEGSPSNYFNVELNELGINR